MKLNRLLELMLEKGASDLHLVAGMPPVLRLEGALSPLEGKPLDASEIDGFAGEMLDKTDLDRFRKARDMDFAYLARGVGRFRVNLYQERGLTAAAIRAVREKIPTAAELGIPLLLEDFALRPRGLILVTGPTGAGKSTTLAALIGHINRTRRCHIITMEDPIEYVHAHGTSLISQREIGRDSDSFAESLRRALRQDPDVILVGEMRDRETIATVLTAAETGHLVFATLHTNSAAETIDRIIDVFPQTDKAQVRTQLAATLLLVFAQQFVVRHEGRPRVPAFELMIATPGIRSLIREGKAFQIPNFIQSGSDKGMFTMEQCLSRLVRDGAITEEEAREHSFDRDGFRSLHAMVPAAPPAAPARPARDPEPWTDTVPPETPDPVPPRKKRSGFFESDSKWGI